MKIRTILNIRCLINLLTGMNQMIVIIYPLCKCMFVTVFMQLIAIKFILPIIKRRKLSSIGSLPKGLQWLRAGQAKDRSLVSSKFPLCVWRPEYLVHPLLMPYQKGIPWEAVVLTQVIGFLLSTWDTWIEFPILDLTLASARPFAGIWSLSKSRRRVFLMYTQYMFYAMLS